MFHGPTELLWIGCLTGLILIPKFRFDTVIPNINSRTCWAKVVLHVMNGTILDIMNFFMFSCIHFLSNRKQSTMSKRAQYRKGRRRACGGKIKAVYIIQPGELQIGLEFWSHKRWEIGARQSRKLIAEFSSVAQSRAPCWRELRECYVQESSGKQG